MELMKKIEQTIGKINSRYGMSTYELEEIRKNMSDSVDGISKGFRYGYMQGMKAAEAKLKERPDHEPKYKNELRQAIYYHVSHTKNTCMLQHLLKMADIFRRRYDDEEYKNVTNLESYQVSAISDILRCKDEERIRCVRALIRGYLYDNGRRKAGATA